jgi:mannose-1-phosphate guanylyltransferase/mannose-6-phosphate isomerase
MVAEQMRSIGVDPSAIILEPVGRNTAPAVAIAALEVIGSGQDPIFLVLPADHVIKNLEAFQKTVGIGKLAAEEGRLVTFGIVPKGPETGYGYIKAVKQRADKLSEGNSVFDVERFEEKPDIATARSYLESGDYFWNSGMFMFKATRYIKELEKFVPEMLASCKKAHAGASRDKDFIRLDSKAFLVCPSDSIDYAVMEKTSDAVIIPIDADWSDVGSWSALWEIGEQDSNGNVIRGDVVSHDTRGCYVNAGSRLVATVGIENHVIVETPDAVLIARKDRVQDVKVIVNQLNAQGRNEAIMHRKVFRPWGSYQSIDNADRFQVKRITVNPGASLSLQMHHHRAEHWIVVKGTAHVTRGEESIMLSENQSTYIPLGVTHRLENPGVIALELIEVQSGGYLGEDDIVRFDDAYGRGSNEKVRGQ